MSCFNTFLNAPSTFSKLIGPNAYVINKNDDGGKTLNFELFHDPHAELDELDLHTD